MSDREEESQTGRGFKVEDRRRFAPTGEPRGDAPVGEDPVEPEPTVTDAAASPGGAATRPGGGAHAAEITFSAFAISLSTQALVHLGEIPSPVGEDSAVDLGAAQQLIDILAVLQEKTRGNLDPAEQSLLESVLYDLRLRYVERAKLARRA